MIICLLYTANIMKYMMMLKINEIVECKTCFKHLVNFITISYANLRAVVSTKFLIE